MIRTKNPGIDSSAAVPVSKSTTLTPAQQRRELAKRIVKHITACRIVMTRSNSPSYKITSRWNALDKCIELERLANGSSSLRSLCIFTLNVSKHLYTILPIASNSSYDTDRNNLESILSDCRENLQSKTYVS